MPVYLKEIEDSRALEEYGSVLIVPCRFCPAASFAVRRKEPYIEFLKHFLKTAAYEKYIEAFQSTLRQKRIRADIFKSHLPHQFVLCAWTSRRRKRLKQIAQNYEAIVVLGCEAAVDTVCDAMEPGSCKVFHGMRNCGIMSIKPILGFPCSVSLDLGRVTPLVHDDLGMKAWTAL